MSDEKKRCQVINHANIMPGFGCCVCRTYNGDHRKECKQCGHKRCDTDPGNQPS